MQERADPDTEQLFQQAADLPPERRPTFLRERCADSQRIARVEALLRHHELAGDRFLIGSSPDSANIDAPPPSAEIAGQRVGPYTILRLIGQGGMGTIFEAEQDHPRRRVALKLIRPGLMTPAMLRRFGHEADLLGRLEHSGIARIYHAGVLQTSQGNQPFFAMELVNGLPLDQWASRNKAPLRRRLEL